jgi:DNA-binding NtrC family response regulator
MTVTGPERILVVDDDPSILASLTLVLKQGGFESRAAASPAEALAWVGREPFDLVLQDMNFSRSTTGDEGLGLLRDVRARLPGVPVVLMTAWGSIPLAVRGMQAGAADFVTKPWSNARLLQALRTVLDVTRATGRGAPGAGVDPAGDGAVPAALPSHDELHARHDFRDVVGSDPALLRLLEVIGRVAPTDAPVLITGESGTGKEVIADALHRNSPRRAGPFVKVNLGGIPAALFEAEMFGHVRGAFTDAKADRAGRFELAEGGTIFLDEIGDLDLMSQVKLLRVLQDRTYEPLGSGRSRTADVRVVSATNRDLPGMVRRAEFREDLLYRLNLIAVRVPPLRERRADIPALARHVLQLAAPVYRSGATELSAEAAAWLQSLDWPGNVRQLRHLVERAVLMADGARLEVRDFALPFELERGGMGSAAPASGGGAGGPVPAPLPEIGSMTLEEIERAMILKAVARLEGNVTRVAEALGLSRAALYRRLDKHGINL